MNWDLVENPIFGEIPLDLNYNTIRQSGDRLRKCQMKHLPEVISTDPKLTIVCVPKSWTDEKIIAYAEKVNACQAPGGWFIRKESFVDGEPQFTTCVTKEDFVHITLDG